MSRLSSSSPSSRVAFHHAIMKAAPEEAKELGCEPDLDAYTMKENPKPNANTNMRTASGHIHIGLEEGRRRYQRSAHD
jgi:hypothetical protein